MGDNGKFISKTTTRAIEVLLSVQATEELLAKILKVDVLNIEEVLNEIRSFGLPLVSAKAEDDQLYYWLEK
jgi:hypothetical protein